MKRAAPLPAVLAAVFCLAPAAALAQGPHPVASGRLDVVGDAPNACVLKAPLVGDAVNATLVSSDTRTTRIQLTQFVDPVSAVPLAASINLSFPLVCNGAHEVTLTATNGALLLEGPQTSAPGFRTRLAYVVQADWAGLHASNDSSTPIALDSQNGAAGLISVILTIPAGGDPMIAGAYSDAITIELKPAT